MAQIPGKRLIAGVLCACLGASALAAEAKFDPRTPGVERDDPDAAGWQESKYVLPAFPKDEDLIQYDWNAVTKAKFFVDKKNIQIGANDGIVRYTLVIETVGGARNTTFEGLQCDQTAVKIYATGRADGTWVENPNAEWKMMRRTAQNLHQALLARNFFCPNFVPIATPKEGVEALMNGIHRAAPGSGHY